MTDLRALADGLAVETPSARLLWHAAVTIDERGSLGRGPLGDRFIVPITGGRFWGGPALETLHGEVLPGGADRQLLRADGIKELSALYEMRVHDGTVFTVHNRVLIDESPSPRYARSVLTVTAPEGPWAWLNRRLLVGTLQSLRPQAQAVLVRVFALD
jgi:Protein of unknown function (DUF3237)